MENKEELAIFGGKPVRENKIFYGGNILTRQMWMRWQQS